jgi:predicted RNase H-like HicB family nuclease
MRYPIAIETGDDTTAYGVIVPDLPGCFSAGDTLDEAVGNAEEAILLYLEDAINGGTLPPKPSTLAELRARPDFMGWTWALAKRVRAS